MPEHVKDDIARGFYHGGPLDKDDYDAGHAGIGGYMLVLRIEG